MRSRLLFLVLAILAVAGFAAQNWPEFNRTSSLNFGVVTTQAPLGLILLTLLGITLLIFLISTATLRTHSLVESRQHAKALQAQRDLAEKAEASRFTDLRQQLDNHLRESRQREAIADTELQKAVAQHQRETRTQLEQLSQLLTSRLGELESRLDSRLQRLDSTQPLRSEHVHVEPVDLDPRGRQRV